MNFGVSFDRKYFILYNKDRLVMKKGYPFFLLHAEGNIVMRIRGKGEKMAKKRRKGFTITELVIVIAVVAILAAVLIPTFANIIDKAQESSDTQAVANMNLSLQNAEQIDGKPATLSEVLDILEGDGMNAHKYSTLKKGTEFVWVPSINRILYVRQSDYSVLYPEEYKSLKWSERKEAWPTLEGAIKGDNAWQDTVLTAEQMLRPESGEDANPFGVVKQDEKIAAIKVDTPEKLVSAVEYLDAQEDKDVDLYLGADIDLAGAEWNSIDRLEGNFNGNRYKVSNLRMTDTTAYSEQIVGGSGKNYTFFAFVSVFQGERFENVTIENVDIQRPGIAGDDNDGGDSFANHTVAGAIGGIYKLGSKGSINTIVSNVTVSGYISGHSRVGGIVGFIGGVGGNDANGKSNLMTGSVTIENCTNNATLFADYTDPTKAGHATAGGIVSIVIQTASNTNSDGFKLLIDGCTNNGSVTGMHAAGILARLSMYGAVLVNDCTNSGTITARVIEGVINTNTGVIEKSLLNSQGTDYLDLIGTASGIFDTFQQKDYFKDLNVSFTVPDEEPVDAIRISIRNCANSGELKTEVQQNGGATFTSEICVHARADANPATLRGDTLTFVNCIGKDGESVLVAQA